MTGRRYWGRLNVDARLLSGAPGAPGGEFLVAAMPSELRGVETLWTVALEAAAEGVAAAAIALLNALHHRLDAGMAGRLGDVRRAYITRTMAELGRPLDGGGGGVDDGGAAGRRRALRCVALLEALLAQSETRGFGGLVAHGARLRGPRVVLSFKSALRCARPNFDAAFFASSCVWDVRVAAGRATGLAPANVRIFTAAGKGREWGEADNARTLAELGVGGGEFKLLRAASPNVAEVPLVASATAGTPLSPPFVDVLREWFRGFSTDGAMSPAQFVALQVRACEWPLWIRDGAPLRQVR